MKAKRGRPQAYPEKLFLRAVVVMIVKRLHKVYELSSVLNEPTSEDLEHVHAVLVSVK